MPLPYLAVDNSNRLLPAEKRDVQFYAKGRAYPGQAGMNIDAVGEPSDLPPVAHSARRNLKLARSLAGASQRVDDLVNRHNSYTYSSGLKKSSGLIPELIQKRVRGKIRAMRAALRQVRTANPRSVEAIAHRLLVTRQALGMSQTDLCRLAGLATNTYNQWENAKGRPELDKALLLCDAFGLTLDWIYRGDRARLPEEIAIAAVAEFQQAG